MSQVDWENAPDWADRYIFSQLSGNRYFSDGKHVFTSGEKVVIVHNDTFLIEMRPDEWKKGAERMEQIAQNGNGGEVYDETDNVNHPEHYQSDNGVECIDAIRAALGQEGFIAYCRGNAIKYNWRSGSKANHAEDLKKGAWYSNRAAEELEDDK